MFNQSDYLQHQDHWVSKYQLQLSQVLTHKRGQWVIFRCIDPLRSFTCRLNRNNSYWVNRTFSIIFARNATSCWVAFFNSRHHGPLPHPTSYHLWSKYLGVIEILDQQTNLVWIILSHPPSPLNTQLKRCCICGPACSAQRLLLLLQSLWPDTGLGHSTC